jgi:hypothetical protein
MKTQLEIVREKLHEDGEITRNWCLERYLTRLSARIEDMVHEGYQIEGSYVKTAHGKDYRYTLIKKPAPKTLTLV